MTANSDGAASPLHSHVVSNLPFRYDIDKAEVPDIFFYAMENAFASKASLNCSYHVLSIGSVVRGLLEKAHSYYDTAQLAGGWEHFRYSSLLLPFSSVAKARSMQFWITH